MYRGSSTVIAAEDTVGYVDVYIHSNGNGREQHAVYLSRRCTRYATRRSFVGGCFFFLENVMQYFVIDSCQGVMIHCVPISCLKVVQPGTAAFLGREDPLEASAASSMLLHQSTYFLQSMVESLI